MPEQYRTFPSAGGRRLIAADAIPANVGIHVSCRRPESAWHPASFCAQPAFAAVSLRQHRESIMRISAAIRECSFSCGSDERGFSYCWAGLPEFSCRAVCYATWRNPSSSADCFSSASFLCSFGSLIWTNPCGVLARSTSAVSAGERWDVLRDHACSAVQ